MSVLERAGLAVLRRLDPERAHDMALQALRAGLVPGARPVADARLRVRLAGLDLPNPVGLAAGFDKNAVALRGLARAGFGFVELGAATPRAQPGNPRPRLFRLDADGAVINRFGFNNDGADAIAARLAARPAGLVVGLNLGANRDSADPAGDFAQVLRRCGAHVDFATVNVSSPNTARLRELQGTAALTALLDDVMAARAALARPVPILLKIAPELDPDALAAIADVATRAGVDAIIATNTTLAREGLKSANRDAQGGLSGQPLFENSTRVLAQLSHATAGRMPLIGVGGVASAAQAHAKLRAGASAVQLYTGLAQHGLSLVGRINAGLLELLARDGADRPADIVGTGRDAWL